MTNVQDTTQAFDGSQPEPLPRTTKRQREVLRIILAEVQDLNPPTYQDIADALKPAVSRQAVGHAIHALKGKGLLYCRDNRTSRAIRLTPVALQVLASFGGEVE